jgi:C1A family cysteine protease
MTPHGKEELSKTPPVRFEVPRFRKPRIKNQGQFGSCTGQAWAREAERERKLVEQSALAIYYEERRLNGECDIDAGAYIRDGAKVVNSYGVPTEKLWPDEPKNVFVDPSAKADKDAARKKFGQYIRVGPSVEEMIACLASGHGFVMGISCYSSMFTSLADRTGIIPYPEAGETMEGGHALQYGGYDLKFRESDTAHKFVTAGIPLSAIPEQVLIFANSWDSSWGDSGYGYLDLRFAADENLADDRWTIRTK